MKLSIIVICWNDRKVILECLQSIFGGTRGLEFEVIVSDNGSTDGSTEEIRTRFPTVRVVENHANLGFAKGNNAGLKEASGKYVLILNPDTIVHEGSLSRWIDFADRNPRAGAFGCRVLNADGTYQESARPFPTLRGGLIAAVGLRPLGYLGRFFNGDNYYGWRGNSEREIDWQSGCCVLFRGRTLRQLGGFDERFFYHFEEVDLCRRVNQAGYQIWFTPSASITHLGGQSVGRFPIRFAIETCRNRIRYFEKYFGSSGVRRCRRLLLIHYRLRRFAYGALRVLRPSDALERRIEMYDTVIQWNKKLDLVAFLEHGIEPESKQLNSLQAI